MTGGEKSESPKRDITGADSDKKRTPSYSESHGVQI